MRILDRIRSRCPDQDGGFGLLESMVSISIITIVMTGLGALLITLTQVSSKQRDSQIAVQIADGVIDKVRAVGAASAVSGRDQTSAQTQFNGHSPAAPDWPATASGVSGWLSSMTFAYDSTASSGSGTSAALPTTATQQTVNGTTYFVNDFVGWCYKAPGAADCTATQTSGSVQNVRVVVAVAWKSSSCPATGCTYVSATLLNGSGDPVFNFNQAAPPSPTMTTIPAQLGAVNDDINGLLGLSGCAAPCSPPVSNYVPPLIYTASGLPAGLSMSGSGVVTGTPTTTGTSTVTVTVTDAFLDTASTQFSWQINPALTFTNPGAHTNTAGQAVSFTVGGASGGTGSGYTWSASNLPTGVSINPNTGSITGTLAISSGAGNTPYPVVVTLSDSSGYRQFSRTFNWTVYYAPLTAVAPPSQVSTVNWSIGTFPLASALSGGSGNVVWSDPTHSLPAGLAISPDKQGVTGVPTALGTSPSVSLTVTDQITNEVKTITLAWSVVVPPTVNNPASVPVTSVLGAVSATAAFNCPHAPCTVTATGLPPGLNLSTPTGTSGSATMSGMITGAAGTYSPVLTITDPSGASSTAAPFSWVVVSAPTITAPANQTTSVGATIPTVTPAYTCPAGSCTFAVSGGSLPAGLSLNSVTGAITGKVTGAAQSYSTTLSITDADFSTATSTFTWSVKAAPTVTTPGTQTVSVGGTNSFTPSTTCAATPCTFSAAGLPGFLSVNPSTGAVSGTGSGAPQTFSGLKITITDVYGSAVTSGVFAWNLVAAPTVTAPSGQSNSVGGIVSVSLANTCPATPCTFAIAGGSLPTGLSLSSAGVISGTIAGVPQTYSNIKVKITDVYSGNSTSSLFSWVVVGAPSITTPANQTTSIGGIVSAFTPGSSCPATPCAFAVATGTLPTGLTLNTSTGQISGTIASGATTAAGLKLKITDSYGSSTSTSAFTWTIVAAPTITTPAAQTVSIGGTANLTPSTTCAGSGCTFSIAAGALPTGLSINASTGLITGTPASLGTTSGIQLRITDAYGSTATTSAFSWTVVAAPTIATPATQTTSIGGIATFTPTTTCAGGGCTFSIAAGTLPAGLSINSATGQITGTVSALATSAAGLKIRITDAYGSATTSGAFSWTIVAAPTISTPASQTTSIGGSGSVTPSLTCAAGGCSVGVAAGTLPAGLSLNTSTGQISGTISAGATSGLGLQLKITDVYGSVTTTGSFSWTVVAAPTLTTQANQTTSLGGAANFSPAATCAGGGCSYALVAGSLPAGLTLNTSTGQITGAPSTSGTNLGLKLRITDAYGSSVTTGTFSWTIVAAPTIGAPASQTASVGATVSFAAPASTCPGTPCTFSLGACALPTGLTVNSATGQVSGVVGGSAGTFSGLKITITDAYGSAATSAAFTVTIKAAPAVAAPANQTTSVGATIPTVNPASSSCPAPACSFALGAGTLPAGLSVNTATGAITGTVTGASGSYPGLKLAITDTYASTTLSAAFTWTVNPAPSVATPATQYISVGGTANFTPSYSCPSTPCTYAVAAGFLPSGLTLNTSTGTFTGTDSSTPQTFSGLKVKITDVYGSAFTSGSFNWTVVAAPTVANPGTQTVSITGHASLAPSYACPSPTCTFSASGLPAWLAIDPTTGAVTGTGPASTTTVSGITITITDTYGASGSSGAFSWQVVAKPSIAQPSPSPTISIGGTTAKYSPVTDTTCPGAPCTYSLVAGSLPAGLTLNSDGSFSGTVSVSATTQTGIKIRVTDAYGVATTMASGFQWSVVAAPTLNSIPSQTSTKSVADIYTPTYTCPGNGPVFGASGLPPGLTINVGTGVISGIPTTKGTYTVTMTLRDQYGSSVSRTFTWTVN